MKKFFKNCRKYWGFCCYSAYTQLNMEVVGMRLGWLWWLLEPAMFMGIYTFVFSVVFGRKMDYLMAYISCGMTMWQFFQRTIISSVGLVKKYTGLLHRVYMPKYVLVISNMLLNLFKMGISFLIVIFFMIYYQIPLSLTIIQIIPVMLVYVLFTFGFSLWIMHLGVYLPDLKKICNVVLQILFYMSGVFYTLDSKLGEGLGTTLLNANPIGRMLHEARNVLFYDTNSSILHMGIWFGVGILLTITGVLVTSHYEKKYIKVV